MGDLEDFMKMISDAVEIGDTEQMKREAFRVCPEDRDLLADYLIEWHKEYAFKPGQQVTWKPGMKNRVFPQYGEPVVFVEYRDDLGLLRPNDLGAADCTDHLDCTIALVQHREKIVLQYAFNSRRLMPFEELDKSALMSKEADS